MASKTDLDNVMRMAIELHNLREAEEEARRRADGCKKRLAALLGADATDDEAAVLGLGDARHPRRQNAHGGA